MCIRLLLVAVNFFVIAGKILCIEGLCCQNFYLLPHVVALLLHLIAMLIGYF